MDKSDRFVQENLELITLLVEDNCQKGVRIINLGKDGKVEFHLEEGVFETTTEEIAKDLEMIKPIFDSFMKDFYGPRVKGIKLRGDHVNVLYSNKLTETVVERSEFIQYLKLAGETKIKILCTSHGIPNNGKSFIRYAQLKTVLKSLGYLKEGIKVYCPYGGTPNRPVVFDVIDDVREPRLGLIEHTLDEAYQDPRLRKVYKNLLRKHTF